MSEAVHPNSDPEYSDPELSPLDESVRPTEALIESASPELPNCDVADEGWQIVDFPDAISLTAIPCRESSTDIIYNSISGSFTMSNPFDLTNPSGSPTEDSALIQQLRQDNAELRTQVAQLEQDLAQLQIELQLEVARFYCKEQESVELSATVRTGQQDEGWSTAQEHITQLTDDLELSHQVVERQQILVETLTNQLENSQERIAQLERDCALTQQRYNEQLQLTLQAENTCRDLRMRLHRQQRQALQFKAALEKSLEGSAAGTTVPVEPEPAVSSTQSQNSESPFFIPKAQPVQPWSTTPETAADRFYAASASDASALPNLLSKLRVSDQNMEARPSDVVEAELPNLEQTIALARLEQATAASTAAASEAIAADLKLNTAHPVDTIADLFPASPIDLPPPAFMQPPQSAIFDLSPFLEAGEVDPASIASTGIPASGRVQSPQSPEKSPEEATQKLSQAPGDSEDTLWADLAKLIQPDAIAENAAIPTSLTIEAGSVGQSTPLASASLPVQSSSEPSDSEAANSASQPNDERDRTFNSQPISPASFLRFETGHSATVQPIEQLQIAAQSASPSFNLAPIDAVSTFSETPSSSRLGASSDSDAASTNWPSPILYPFRPPRKLKSMAAVELPTFPRTGQ
ncbi:MAG: hypothetical protein HC866_13230 [Leptolyngbyaceae cyanobacterium RU_5_1]|nr:hypothetical protein [Leptolyngbyaceae cyanobacterium RU_5_1]